MTRPGTDSAQWRWWMWRAAPGSRSSWLASAALSALVLMLRRGWPRWPGSEIPDATSGWAICMPSRGRHLKVSPGAWALAPLRLVVADKVDSQAAMVSLGRPGARALASSGPAYEAIQNVGEARFHRAAVEQARGKLRDGLPLRAEINVVGYLARKPEGGQRA
jgi:hypothetical protein